MQSVSLDIETALKIRLDRILETLSRRHNRSGQVIDAKVVCFHENSDDSCASSKFLQLQKKRLIDLQKKL